MWSGLGGVTMMRGWRFRSAMVATAYAKAACPPWVTRLAIRLTNTETHCDTDFPQAQPWSASLGESRTLSERQVDDVADAEQLDEVPVMVESGAWGEFPAVDPLADAFLGDGEAEAGAGAGCVAGVAEVVFEGGAHGFLAFGDDGWFAAGAAVDDGASGLAEEVGLAVGAWPGVDAWRWPVDDALGGTGCLGDGGEDVCGVWALADAAGVAQEGEGVIGDGHAADCGRLRARRTPSSTMASASPAAAARTS